MTDTIRRRFAIASAAVYLGSLLPEAYCTKPDGDCTTGFLAAALGALGGNWSWVANPLLFVALFLLWRTRRRIAAAVLAIAAVAFALSFLVFREVTQFALVTDCGGCIDTADHVAIGYWIWLLSLVIAATGAAIDALTVRRTC